MCGDSLGTVRMRSKQDVSSSVVWTLYPRRKEGLRLLYVDSRWNGNHGIGRFSREVGSRISAEFVALRGNLRPSSAADPILPARLRLKRSDVLYSPSYNCGPTRATQIITIHDLIHLDDPGESSRAKSVYYKRLVKPVVQRAGIVLTVSESSRDRLIEWLNDDAVDVRVIGNGSSPAFHPLPGQVLTDHPTFLYVGNLRSHKNVGVVLEALRQRPDYRLVMVTPSREEASTLADRHRVRGQVSTLSGLSDDELAVLYRGAQATLMPSLLEGFGFPALESFLCDTPVVYWSGCASVAEISDGSGIGVADASNPDEWATAMDRASADRESLLLASAGHWRERYDWGAVAARVNDVLAHYPRSEN